MLAMCLSGLLYISIVLIEVKSSPFDLCSELVYQLSCNGETAFHPCTRVLQHCQLHGLTHIIDHFNKCSSKKIDSPECNQKLLENRDNVPDSAYSESSYENNFKGQYVRDSSNEEQAWCPLNKVGKSMKEFVSVDLGRLSVIKMVMTRGRNAIGYGSAQKYYIEYKQENQSEWKFYKNYSGSQELIARKDPLNENFISLEPPLITRWLRVYPYLTANDKICLKLQLYGCINTNHVVEYRMIDGSKYAGFNSARFKDTTYDGTLMKNGTLIGGIGKLTDRDIESNTASNPIVDSATKYVGWDRNQLKQAFVTLIFRFDSARNFSALSVRVANLFDNEIRVFNMIVMTFGWHSDGWNILRKTGTQKEKIENDDRIRISRWKEIKINNFCGNFVKIDLYFASQWIILSEIYFHSEPAANIDEEFSNNFLTDIPINIKAPNQVNDQNINFNFNVMPLAHTLGLICGILGIIILFGFCLLLYMHNRRKRNSPTKERVIQLKYPDDENFFLANENQFYSTKLNKGTIIPFNISPYKYCSTQRSSKNLPPHTQGLLTPKHNIVNVNSPKVIIKSSPIHNNRGIDSCIYTSLPASDTESLGTPDRKSNNLKQILPSVIQNSALPLFWNNQTIRGSISPDKLFYNSIDDNSSFTFQCFRDNQMPKEINNAGLIYTNQSNFQEYDSFKSPTLNDTDPESDSITNKYSSELDLPIHDSIAGCCGNSNYFDSSNGQIQHFDGTVPQIRIDNLSDLAPLGSGRWGELFIDISFPTEFEFQYNTQREELSPSCDFNGWESRAALVKILDENAPFEIREKFFMEYSLAVAVNHENICRVFAANFDINILRPFIISEYSVHGNLYNYFQNICYGSKFNFFDTTTLGFQSKLNFSSHQQTVLIILQLAKALNYLEGLHLIHRDIACRNCLVFQISECELKIKLSDSAMSQAQFSSCYVRPRSVLQNFPVSHLPLSISSALLPLRWSPCESIIDSEFSAKSDVYAFGITAWEIFTKCRTQPFSEIGDEQLVLNAMNLSNNHIEKLTPLSLPSQCAKEMNDFILQCIHPIPDNRPNFHDICTFLQNKINRSV